MHKIAKHRLLPGILTGNGKLGYLATSTGGTTDAKTMEKACIRLVKMAAPIWLSRAHYLQC